MIATIGALLRVPVEEVGPQVDIALPKGNVGSWEYVGAYGAAP
ncbi:MAG: hypothetical protein M0008_13960 [Actinomycetota bacterium]|nr:hypothetical protein [Actinomycetota bacterium]